MPQWKEGDRVRVVTRAVTEEDRKKNRYFDHMAGLTGTVQNVYADGEIAVKVDQETLSDISRGVHETAVTRMREKVLGSISEEQKKGLTKEELEFGANHLVLVQTSDLEKN